VDVDLIGWIGVGLGGSYGCRCGILYAPMLGVVYYVGLVSPTSSFYPSPFSPYSSELIRRGGGIGLPPGFCYVCVGMAHLFYGSGYLVSFFCFLGYWGSCSWCVRV